MAYLAQRNGPVAAAEFQKFLDHPTGIVQNVLLGSLAHFQLARAYALQGDTAKARTAPSPNRTTTLMSVIALLQSVGCRAYRIRP